MVGILWLLLILVFVIVLIVFAIKLLVYIIPVVFIMYILYRIFGSNRSDEATQYRSDAKRPYSNKPEDIVDVEFTVHEVKNEEQPGDKHDAS